jgi:hypothetical protein
MKLRTCGCQAVYYQRIRRSGWMKLVGSRRLYRCMACNAVLFIPLVPEAEAFDDSLMEQAEDRGNNRPA